MLSRSHFPAYFFFYQNLVHFQTSQIPNPIFPCEKIGNGLVHIFTHLGPCSDSGFASQMCVGSVQSDSFFVDYSEDKNKFIYHATLYTFSKIVLFTYYLCGKKSPVGLVFHFSIFFVYGGR